MPDRTSYGVIFSIATEGERLIRRKTVKVASVWNVLGNPIFKSKHRTFFIKFLFIRYATPFGCRVLRTVKLPKLPSNLQKLLNFFEQNSNPLYVWRHLTCFLVLFSIIVFHSLKVANTLFFFFKKKIQTFREKSLIIGNK